MSDLRKTRAEIRQRRRQQADATRILFSREICKTVGESVAYQPAKKIAVFQSFDGEVDLDSLIDQALNDGKQLFLPILPAKDWPLSFAWFDRQSKLVENRFGILEPDVPTESLLDPRELDLVITPLVAFDAACNRLGVGGGFYDRTFAFRKDANVLAPQLIGVAFELQKVDCVVAQAWDVRLDGVVTEAGFYSPDGAS